MDRVKKSSIRRIGNSRVGAAIAKAPGIIGRVGVPISIGAAVAQIHTYTTGIAPNLNGLAGNIIGSVDRQKTHPWFKPKRNSGA